MLLLITRDRIGLNHLPFALHLCHHYSSTFIMHDTGVDNGTSYPSLQRSNYAPGRISSSPNRVRRYVLQLVSAEYKIIWSAHLQPSCCRSSRTVPPCPTFIVATHDSVSIVPTAERGVIALRILHHLSMKSCARAWRIEPAATHSQAPDLLRMGRCIWYSAGSGML